MDNILDLSPREELKEGFDCLFALRVRFLSSIQSSVLSVQPSALSPQLSASALKKLQWLWDTDSQEEVTRYERRKETQTRSKREQNYKKGKEEKRK